MKLQKFSRNIIRLRKQRGWSQPELAARAKMPKGTVFKMETWPDANPTLHSLERVAKALGVDVSLIVS